MGTIRTEVPREILAQLDARASRRKPAFPAIPTAPAQIVVLLESGRNGRDLFIIPTTSSPVMPDRGDSLIEVRRDSDPMVESVLRFAQIASYWMSHSLVYAELAAINDPVPGQPQHTLLLRPRVTLSGSLDPGLVPELTATMDIQKFGPMLQPLAMRSKVLVLVRDTGSAYSVAAEGPEYMPGYQRRSVK